MSDYFKKIQLLKDSELFQEVCIEELAVVADAFVSEHYNAGDRVFDIKQQGDCMYMIHSGKIGISTHDKPVIKDFVTTLGAGKYFGEMTIIDDLPRSATAHVIEDSHLYSIEKNKLRDLIIQYPELSIGMLKSLSLRIRQSNTVLNIPAEKNQV